MNERERERESNKRACPITGKRCYIKRKGQLRIFCIGCSNYKN